VVDHSKENSSTIPQIVYYDVGGSFSYTLDGVTLSNPLWPDTIQVFPDPLLGVKYFWQKDVFSDDPFTPEVEPSEPFYLGLMMTNFGYGTAKNMKMTSSQPKIIDNKKGLLVDFKLVGAQVNMSDISPSLTVNLGDLWGQSTTVVKWILTCSLAGTFISYDASYQHISPIGDADISLIDSLSIHELIHVVLIEGEDDLWDFLTNENLDPNYLPDTFTALKIRPLIPSMQ